MADNLYSIDTSALLHAWRRAYRPKNFPNFWRQMDKLILDGRAVMSIEVYNEIQKKDDDVSVWCKERKGKLVVDLDEPCQQEVRRILAAHPRLMDTKKGRHAADPFAIALASTGDKKIVLTQESVGPTKITGVCDHEKIKWLYLADFIEAEKWSF